MVDDFRQIGALTPARQVQGPRLTSVNITSSTEGAAITRLFGRTRLAGRPEPVKRYVCAYVGGGGGTVGCSIARHKASVNSCVVAVPPRSRVYTRRDA